MAWPRPEPEVSSLPVIFVAGLGRCGSTLTMNMLAAAGVSCVGRAPAYEVEEVNHRAPSEPWLRSQRGRALKLLDPHHCAPLPDTGAVVIWLDRDPIEQARSQAKFAHLVAGFPKASRKHVQAIAGGLRRDRPAARRALAGRVLLDMTFEWLLAEPEMAAAQIVSFLTPWFHPLNAAAMAAVVQRRPSDCAPGLDIELELLAAADAGRR